MNNKSKKTVAVKVVGLKDVVEKVDKPKSAELTEKRKTGNLGEDVACTYLEKHDFSIVERNFLRKYGEIDIVAEKSGVIHFIEVKSVTSSSTKATEDARETDAYRPEDNLHPWKLKRLSRTIQTYISERKVKNVWQFDVMTVVLHMKTRRARVEFMENIII